MPVSSLQTHCDIVWGLHSLGNAGKVDQLGFLVPLGPKDDPVTYSFTRISGKSVVLMILGGLKTGLVPKDKIGELNKTNCWLCEGWTQHKFEFTPGISSDKQVTAEQEVTVH